MLSQQRYFWTTVAAVLNGGACQSWHSECLNHLPSPPAGSSVDGASSVRKSFVILRDATEFESAYVSVGFPSCQAIAFQTILESKSADLAFKSLLKKGTLVGQLYGVCGVYFTDPTQFDVTVQDYVGRNESVATRFGDVLSSMQVSELVERPGAVSPSALPQWHAENPLAEYAPVDIVSGGWCHEFRTEFD